MTDLFIAPAAGSAALDHLNATVRARVPLSKLKGLSDDSLEAASKSPNGVAAWGTQAGTDDINVTTWEAIKHGDWVLFYSDGHFPLTGRILAKDHSPTVAGRLWGSDQGGRWEYMYLLDELREIDVPRPLVLKALDYNEGFYPRGFIRVNRDLEAQYGTVEELLEHLAATGHTFKRAVDAARAGDDAGTAAALDSAGQYLSEKSVVDSVASYVSAEAPEVREAIGKRIKRNRKLVADLKALYKGRCQCCEFTFLKADGEPYSEAAHIRRISLLQPDLDVKDNLLILCPNHHKMLDLGAVQIRYEPAEDALLLVDGDQTVPIVNKHVGPGRP